MVHRGLARWRRDHPDERAEPNDARNFEHVPGRGARRWTAIEQVQPESGAEQQRERPRVGAEVGAGRVAGLVEGGHERSRREREANGHEREPVHVAADEREQHAHRERPHQVPLLLDRERPRVAQREEAGGVPVDLLPILHVEERRQTALAERVALAGRDHEPGVGRDAEEHDQQRREQPPQPAPDEARVADSLRAPVLEHQEARDEKAREHEEDVDAEEPASGPLRGALVVRDHGDDREGAQAVERSLVFEGPSPRCALVHAVAGPTSTSTSPSGSRVARVAGPQHQAW